MPFRPVSAVDAGLILERILALDRILGGLFRAAMDVDGPSMSMSFRAGPKSSDAKKAAPLLSTKSCTLRSNIRELNSEAHFAGEILSHVEFVDFAVKQTVDFGLYVFNYDRMTSKTERSRGSARHDPCWEGCRFPPPIRAASTVFPALPGLATAERGQAPDAPDTAA
ncbi:hypothetical protein [Labrys monachus]|uniref:Uncharacterized protein n=1 Tax=Labrys monachus TaxID=217067 RepID=A0ABU0F9C1_9HYPH|nr:hypothetical protein [Labrys monachus]MDQ0391208.1 hypothetical protein [Labrys monachus]